MNTENNKVEHTQGELWIDDDGFVAISDGEDLYETMAEVLCESLSEEERENNKEHIVRCWNNFYPMLEALKNVLGMCAYPYKEMATYKEALAAIKAAEQQ
jgi:hypothetical protein